MSWARWQAWLKSLPSRCPCIFARMSAVVTRPLFRSVVLSAALQMALAVLLWLMHPKQAIELNTPSPLELTSPPTETHAIQTDAPTDQPSNSASKPESPPRAALQRDTSAPIPYTSDKGAMPLTANRPTQERQNPPSNEPIAPSSTPQIASSQQLKPVAVPSVSMQYQLTLTDDSHTWEGPTTYYEVKRLNGNQFSVIMTTKAPQGQGIMSFRHVFHADDTGWRGGQSSGGITIKSALSATGHGSRMPAEFSQSHSDFLDRVSIIAYLQGWLINHAKTVPHTLLLPIYSYGGVQQRAFQLTPAASTAHCHPCIRATALHGLSEVNQLEILYSGSANWQPVEINFQVNTQPRTHLHLRAINAP